MLFSRPLPQPGTSRCCDPRQEPCRTWRSPRDHSKTREPPLAIDQPDTVRFPDLHSSPDLRPEQEESRSPNREPLDGPLAQKEHTQLLLSVLDSQRDPEPLQLVETADLLVV